MPSVSEKQRRAMQAAAHGKSTIGIPASVGKEFVAADKGSARSRDEHMARKAKHMSQKEVAADFGRHQSTVSRAAMRQGFSRSKV